MKEEGTNHKADDNTSATHHTDYADQSARLVQRAEIHIVGNTQEDTYQRDTPRPVERRTLLPARVP